MRLKKIGLMILGVVTVTSIGTYGVKAQMATVYRENVSNIFLSQEDNNAENNELNFLSGQAGEKEENWVVVKNGYNNEDVRVNINNNTMIIDASLRTAALLSDLKENSSIDAYADTAMTFSIPPMTRGEALIINKQNDEAAPVYFVIDEIIKNEDGSISILDAAKSLQVTINSDTIICPYRTRNIITVQDIKAGDRVVVWKKVAENGIQTLELPQKVTAENCIIYQGE